MSDKHGDGRKYWVFGPCGECDEPDCCEGDARDVTEEIEALRHERDAANVRLKRDQECFIDMTVEYAAEIVKLRKLLRYVADSASLDPFLKEQIEEGLND